MKRIPYKVMPDRAVAQAMDDHRQAIHDLQDLLPTWREIDVEFSGAGVDTPVRHGLSGATRYLPVRKTAACDVYDGVDSTGAYESGVLWVRGTAAATVTLRIWSS